VLRDGQARSQDGRGGEQKGASPIADSSAPLVVGRSVVPLLRPVGTIIPRVTVVVVVVVAAADAATGSFGGGGGERFHARPVAAAQPLLVRTHETMF
jgi:hypothetical protein